MKEIVLQILSELNQDNQSIDIVANKIVELIEKQTRSSYQEGYETACYYIDPWNEDSPDYYK